VVASWVVSPLCAGLVGAILFTIVRFGVLLRKNSTTIAYWVSICTAFVDHLGTPWDVSSACCVRRVCVSNCVSHNI
jgi:phosphate/sulfate permease